MDNNTTRCSCGCQRFVTFDGRIDPGDVVIMVGEDQVMSTEEDEGDTEPEDVEFPREVKDLNIKNNIGNSGCIEFSFLICTGCRKVQ